MSGRISYKVSLLFAALVLCGLSAKAQTFGSYTPYSIFGVGDLYSGGTAYNKTMGGVGIASRNHRFINPMNPAAVTARDSLAFMADYSMFQDNKIFQQGDLRSASNTTNIGDLIISFPLWRSSAMMVGIMPYSNTGYDFGYSITDPYVIGHTGNINYLASGQGSIYKLFASAGVTFWRRLSLGVEGIYYFGKIAKSYDLTFSESSYNDALGGYVLQLRAPAAKVGVQYEQPLGTKSSLTVGATYLTRAQVGGFMESYRYSSGTASADTLEFSNAAPQKVYLASEKGIGLSYRYADKFQAEIDYTRSDWRNSGLDVTPGFTGNTVASEGRSVFTNAVSESYRAGFEYTPNRNDIRYYMRRVTYRGGLYYKNEYYKLDNTPIYAYGITLGATFPVFRWYNGITVGMDFGQRGSLTGALVRETYFNFSIGFSLFDIWFQKFSYD